MSIAGIVLRPFSGIRATVHRLTRAHNPLAAAESRIADLQMEITKLRKDNHRVLDQNEQLEQDCRRLRDLNRELIEHSICAVGSTATLQETNQQLIERLSSLEFAAVAKIPSLKN